MSTTRTNLLLPALIAAVMLVVLAAPAPAKMVSRKLGPNVCQTTGGGRFVDVPGFPGERIDQRLLGDLRLLERRYKIFVTDGLSHDPVHAANGEHPLGLGVDIVPDVARGGTWRDISALARWAEPTQDHPIAPFRWVGYDGDAGHGRGNHLHLSWNHSETRPFHPAATVDTLRCPTGAGRRAGGGGVKGPDGGAQPADGGSGQPAGASKPDGDKTGGRGGKRHGERGPTGGVGTDPAGSGGVGVGRIAAELERQARHPVIETGGVGIR